MKDGFVENVTYVHDKPSTSFCACYLIVFSVFGFRYMLMMIPESHTKLFNGLFSLIDLNELDISLPSTNSMFYLCFTQRVISQSNDIRNCYSTNV